MTLTERRVAAADLRAILAALEAVAGAGRTLEAAELRRATGALAAEAEDRVEAFTFGASLAECFRLARAAGATLDAMDRVRASITPRISHGPASLAVLQTGIRLALITSARIVAATVFVSRQDVDAALARLVPAFDAATEFAADRLDQTNFRALTALQAALVRDLTQRARPLPRMVSYSLPRRRPALAIANLFYGDGSRVEELVAENRGMVHPLFAPASGRRLSA
ncbi:hypothetical protein [Methylobacterium oryzisoli]|uniref:hypothetical protein n=1 Tax=Methylobacterium oryzisoli TaxID=3385502 RepID=UPI00389243EC